MAILNTSRASLLYVHPSKQTARISLTETITIPCLPTGPNVFLKATTVPSQIPPTSSTPPSKRCNSTQCPAVSYSIVNTVGSTNLSLCEKENEPLYALVSKSTTAKPFFWYKFSGNVTLGLTCLNMGENVAGYYSFTPFLLCADDVLAGCKNGPVEDGTAIKICGSNTFDNGQPQPNGDLRFLKTVRTTSHS
ncbi:uncharacterized protein RAG0_06611 [Rhynchosporium agropyri]|uniref:Uncharacterized protein n=1 Tax=Rhynchosporium agropyri TaxID=914238 RepID=A0A1E1KLB9_9HELO|nr:uncharacterized protein RAG0_06611 [Rhynchosporium agropyri]